MSCGSTPHLQEIAPSATASIESLDDLAAVRMPVGELRLVPEFQSELQPNQGDSLPRLRWRLRWYSGRGVPVARVRNVAAVAPNS